MILDLDVAFWVLLVLGAACVITVLGLANRVVHDLTVRRREARIRRAVGNLGLEVQHGDPHGLIRLPTGITDRGNQQRILFTVTGALDGVPVRVAELEYRRSHRSAGDPVTMEWMWFVLEALRRFLDLSTRRRLTIAAVEVPGANWPHLQVDARGEGATRSARQQVQRTIAFESDEFNRTFHVTGEDRRFASYLLGPLAIDRLLRHGRRFDYEVKGRWVVAISTPLRGIEVLEAHRAVLRLVATVQPVAFEVYGGAPLALPRTADAVVSPPETTS